MTNKDAIKASLAAMSTGDFLEKSKNLLATLGYRSERTLELSGAVDEFIEDFPARNANTKTEQEFRKNTESVKIVFQFTSDESAYDPNLLLLREAALFEEENTKSFLFCAVELKENNYSRTKYAAFTREINKRLRVPTVVLFRVANRLTVGFSNRRPSYTHRERDVLLGQVTLIKDICLNLNNLHRAHIDILSKLSLDACVEWMDVNNKPKTFDSLLAAWLTKLDIEELNKEFYGKLFAWFEWAVEEAKFPTDAQRVLKPEQHVIRLITRLLFVWFLKEKGLVADELFNKTQIQGLLTEDDFDTGDSYYRVVLQNLFFATLNTETHKRKFSYKDQMRDPDKLLEMFGKTPFINGGLFDCLDSDEATDRGGDRIDLSIPNCLFFDKKRGLLSIFEEYKFTVEENTPIEQEVALDPELLGRVFEHLLAEYNPETRGVAENARKKTGSYYTPRAIVDYMVEEALVATLSQKCDPIDDKRLHYLLDYAQTFDDAKKCFDDAEKDDIVRAISELKILDPAVGSGAFPMGMLHKLTLALRRLDPDNKRWEQLQKERAGKRATAAFDILNQQERDAELSEISKTFELYRDSDFGRKLYLIQNSIFGVDIQSVACQIAKLRFFISLAIEQEPEQNAVNFGIKPLPNLETRFIAANTLIGLKAQETFTSDTAKDLKQALRDNREQHFHATTRQRKSACKRKDTQLRADLAAELKRVGMPSEDVEKIAKWDVYDQNASADWFDPEWMFGVADGFDVVIGNPPYAKSENVPEDKREQLTNHYDWGSDLYDYFISAGFKLVSQKGIFTYIANDSYVTFSTKRKIRDLFLQNRLLQLVKAPANTFEATIYTAIFMLLKQEPGDSHVYMSGEMNFPDFQYHPNGPVEYATVHKIPDQKFLLSGKDDWVLRLLTLENVERYCRVLDTGIHSGNVRTKIFFKENNGRRHRLLQGKQIQRFSLQWDSPKAKYLFCDINYEPLPIPGIGRGGKPSTKNEYWHFCGDIENHHQPGRLLMRQSDDDLIVAYHSEATSGRFYTDNTLFTILPKSQKMNLKYFLGLFNSRLLNFVYHSISQEKGKSQAQVKVKVVQKLPVVVPSEEEQLPIIALVDEILEAKTATPDADTASLENEIDNLVYALYGLTPEEIRIVKGAV